MDCYREQQKRSRFHQGCSVGRQRTSALLLGRVFLRWAEWRQLPLSSGQEKK